MSLTPQPQKIATDEVRSGAHQPAPSALERTDSVVHSKAGVERHEQVVTDGGATRHRESVVQPQEEGGHGPRRHDGRSSQEPTSRITQTKQVVPPESTRDADAEVTLYSSDANLSPAVNALRMRRSEILSRWQSRVGDEPFHLGRKSRAVANHIPALVDAIIDSLAQDARLDRLAYSPIDRPEVHAAATAHASARLSQGLLVGEVVMELRILRHEISRGLREELSDASATGAVLATELLVNDALDAAIMMAVNSVVESAEQMQNDLVTLTAHDLKAPLATVGILRQLVQRRVGKLKITDSRLRSYFEGMSGEINRMALVIDQVTAAAQVSGTIKLNVSVIDLRQLLEQTISILGDEARSRVRIVWTRKSKSRCEWDALRIQHALQNLISNALKYAPAGLITVAIEDGGRREVLIKVTDDGIGLSDEDRKQLFAKYYRTPEAIRRKIAGSGLGLFITKSMIEAHGGSLGLSSPGPGKGTTATITLPSIIPDMSRRSVSLGGGRRGRITANDA